MSNEFDLIARVRARVEAASADPAVLIGIGDDAAVVLPSPGMALVTSTDTLVAERHFRPDWPAEDLGHLALAVNLSDLAAMAATPRWALLSLTLPDADEAWLDGFLDGFLALAERAGTRLIGGNIASGPLNLGVTLIGQADPTRLARRAGATLGQQVLVSGSLGDAAGGLTLEGQAPEGLVRRLRRPEPRLAVGSALAGQVASVIDISDGLLADLAHLLPPGLGARLDLGALPTSPELLAAFPDDHQRWNLQLKGGGDYELLWTMDPAQFQAWREKWSDLADDVTVIGEVTAEPGIACRQPNGDIFATDRSGWDHFEC
ncbi:MAG: thiamine-phosphate kinase [Wenzhouxiangella sp.]|nr:thiamine-phosphate kinase [Wenzhouxiangella sp.]